MDASYPKFLKYKLSDGRLTAAAFQKIAQNSRNLQFSDDEVPVPGTTWVLLSSDEVILRKLIERESTSEAAQKVMKK